MSKQKEDKNIEHQEICKNTGMLKPRRTTTTEQANSFNYLGSLITSGNCSNIKIQKKISIAKDAFSNHKTIPIADNPTSFANFLAAHF